MLSTRAALSTLRPHLRPPTHGLRRHPPRRTFISSTIQTLSDGFLDLSIALPYPPEWPAYSCTIILVTVVSRLVFTVPFSIWAKNRQWRTESVVIPQLKAEMPAIHKQVQQDMKKDKFRGDKEAVIAEINKRARPIAQARQKALQKLHGCTTAPTIALPILTQLPLFVGTSAALAQACAGAHSGLDAETFLTLTSLARPDATAALPIALGLATLANVESARWFLGGDALAREARVAAWAAARRAKGEQVIEPRKMYQSGLRALAVARILIAAVVPGGVQLYWVTSATFGLFQSWVLDYWDMRRRSRATPAAIPPAGNPPSP